MAIPRLWSLFLVVLLALAGFAGADGTAASVRTTAKDAPSTSSLLQGSCRVADDEFFASRPIDTSSCGLEGSGDAHKLQNQVKNNLCAGGFLTNSPTADPARVTQFSFRKLEEERKGLRTAYTAAFSTTSPTCAFDYPWVTLCPGSNAARLVSAGAMISDSRP